MNRIHVSSNSDLICELRSIADSRPGRNLKFCTHGGDFHADELLATAVLMQELPQYKIEVIRTRNPQIMRRCDIVYDVGGGKYDHHGINKVFYPNGIPMAACGKILNDAIVNRDLVEGLRRKLFYAVEAHDNGAELPPFIAPSRLGFVSAFSLNWTERYDDRLIDRMFFEALPIVRRVYERITEAVIADIKATEYINTKAEKIYDGKFLLLDQWCPAYDYTRTHPEFLGSIYPRANGWTIRLAPSMRKKYATKIRAPESWRGKYDTELDKSTGLTDGVFCHNAGFICVFKTRDAAIKAAKILSEQPLEDSDYEFEVEE